NDRMFWALARARQGVARALLGQLAKARQDFTAAAVPLERIGNPLLLKGLGVLEGFVDLCEGHPHLARERLQGISPETPSSFLRMAVMQLEEEISKKQSQDSASTEA
ncbi:MAG: hypothetical protein AAFV53_14730, partial [Myxococcota bacterium]